MWGLNIKHVSMWCASVNGPPVAPGSIPIPILEIIFKKPEEYVCIHTRGFTI